MKKKETQENNQRLINEYEEKTAKDNQWTSVVEAGGAHADVEKTATDNQWVSTNKNAKK